LLQSRSPRQRISGPRHVEPRGLICTSIARTWRSTHAALAIFAVCNRHLSRLHSCRDSAEQIELVLFCSQLQLFRASLGNDFGKGLHACPHGGTLMAGTAASPPLPCPFIDCEIFLVGCGRRWVCGQRRAFPRLCCKQNGGSAAGRLKADCPHIHGCEAGVLYRAGGGGAPW
jgi:hypothetical protein